MPTIQSLTDRARQLSQSVEWWNTAMIWALVFAALAAIAVVVTTRIALNRAKQLADAQAELLRAKDEELQRDLGSKDVQIEQAKRQAGEANKLAEDERLARVLLESKVAWRRINPRGQAEMASRLIDFSGESALVAYSPNDLEASTFASDIAATLQKAKWQVSEPLAVLSLREGPVPLGTNPPLPTGVRVWSTDDERSRNAARAITEQLSSRGFDAMLSAEVSSLISIHRSPTRVVLSVEHKPEGAQGEYKLREGSLAKR